MSDSTPHLRTINYWEIDNFSALKQEDINDISFTIPGTMEETTIRATLYPKHLNSNENCVQIALVPKQSFEKLENENEDDYEIESTNLKAKLQLALLDSNEQKCYVQECEIELYKRVFKSGQNQIVGECQIFDFLRENFFEPANNLLTEDKLKIVIEGEIVEYSKESIFEYATEYTWTIENVSTLAHTLKSPEISLFVPSKISFNLYYHPNGFSSAAPNDPFITLCCEDSKKENLNFWYRVAILDSNGNFRFNYEGWSKIVKFNLINNLYFTIRRDYLMDPQNGLISDDKLTLSCKIMIYES